MSRIAKVAGGVAFAVALMSVGTIGWAFLLIRSPLPNGGVAAGPKPTAYVVVGVAVLAGSAVFGWCAALAVEFMLRIVRSRRSS